jgi:hypothetical protein
MRICSILIFFLIISSVAFAQKKKVTPVPKKKPVSSEHIFVRVEQETGFPGGQKKFQQFVSKRFNLDTVINALPDTVKEFTDSVFVKLVIKKDGQMTVIETSPSFSAAFDNEIKRVLLLSAPWKPAYACGFPVNSYRTYVFIFSLLADTANVTVLERDYNNFPEPKKPVNTDKTSL